MINVSPKKGLNLDEKLERSYFGPVDFISETYQKRKSADKENETLQNVINKIDITSKYAKI